MFLVDEEDPVEVAIKDHESKRNDSRQEIADLINSYKPLSDEESDGSGSGSEAGSESDGDISE